MAATNKTQVISAADFQASKGRKSAVAKPAHVPQEPPAYEAQPERPSGLRCTFAYMGKVVSNNKTYSGMHWAKRNALTDHWHGVFRQLFVAAGLQPMQKFSLSLRFNSRHDVDNLSLLTKWCVDTMKGPYIPDDTKKHYRGISVNADESLPHNCFVFTITELV